ncbi:MAG: magnesium chelatase, partial [Alistipes sp.]|nr:magnesium chelatase [Alistipes sp.]
FENMKIKYNSQLNGNLLRRFCVLDGAGDELLRRAYEKYHLSARGYVRLLRVARTIADLEHSKRINASHISEAVCFRNIGFWVTE